MKINRGRASSRLITLSAAGAGLAIAIFTQLGTAPAARADATDDAFVAALKAHGIVHESGQAEVTAGHLVCHQLAAGKNQDEIAMDVMNSSTLDGASAGYFVAVAERAYCPQYSDAT